MSIHPVVTDDDVFVRCGEKEEILQQELPHRTVWGMVYSPATHLWLVQWRRFDKQISPNLWDVSCAGHVDCLEGEPETYKAAYEREFGEELGLKLHFPTHEQWCSVLKLHWQAEAPTLDLGYSREYHVRQMLDGRRLVKEHVHLYLSVFDGPIALGPESEPQAIAWLPAERILSDIVEAGRATEGLATTMTRCQQALLETQRV